MQQLIFYIVQYNGKSAQINMIHKHKKEFYVFTLVSDDVGTVVSAGSCASV